MPEDVQESVRGYLEKFPLWEATRDSQEVFKSALEQLGDLVVTGHPLAERSGLEAMYEHCSNVDLEGLR